MGRRLAKRFTLRSILCLFSETPHERMLKFQKAMTGISMPTWLLTPGTVLLRRFIHNKSDPQCEQVKLLDSNPTYAHIMSPNGRESTVSTFNFVSCPAAGNERQKVPGDVDPPTEPTDSSTD